MTADPAATSPVSEPLTARSASTASPSTARRVLTVVVGAVLAVIATALVSIIALALGASSEFPPLQPRAYVFLAVLGYLAGLAGWSIIRAKAKKPGAVLRWLVPTVLILSFIPDVLLLVSQAMPGTSAGSIIALMVMHLAVAAPALAAFQRALPVSR